MKNAIKPLLIVVLVVGVILIAAFATGEASLEKITFEEYKNVIKKSAIVYYGKSDDAVSVLAENNDMKIKYLSSLEKGAKDLKENTLYVYKNGKEVYKYDGDFNSYKLQKGLMDNNIIERSFLTVSLKEYKELVKAKGYHFMFIGRETCSYCVKFKDSIKEAMKDNDFMVYYIDTDTFSGENDFNELIATDKYMSENEWGTPLSLLYKDGKRVDVLNGYVEASQLVEFLKTNKVI